MIEVGLVLSLSSEEEKEKRVKGLLEEELALVKAVELVALQGPEKLLEKKALELGDSRYKELVSGVAAAVAGAGRRRGGVADIDARLAPAVVVVAEGIEVVVVVGATNIPRLLNLRSRKKIV